jgi:ceramide glucosyltransferase
VTGGSALGWAVLAGSIAVRLISLAVIQRILGEREATRWLWLVPLKDLVTSLVWAGGFSGREVTWSGQVLRISRDGRMTAVHPAPEPEHVETLRAARG